MCGIAGIVDYARPAERSAPALATLRRRLRHRGPDGEGEAFSGAAALTHVRLAMVDAPGGAQPWRSADGRYLLVYNGELYNHDALRAQLGGPWRSRCDTETLLAAWQAWGEGCLSQLDGMFAFFLWDAHRQEGFAVRDPLGVKPLAYRAEPGGAFAFASEAKALLSLDGRAPRADEEAVVEYLVAPAFSGVARSPFQGVCYLPPGHLLRVHRDGVSLRCYWRPTLQPDPSLDAVEAARALRDALEDATAGALRSDAPLGLFLSGGLDSTALAALARRHGARPRAFTLTFDGQERWDARTSALVVSNDAPFAREAAAAFELPLEEVPFPRRQLATELQALARVNDALPAWEQELSQRALARAASRHVKGVLVGDAADETHYGYHFLLDAAASERPAAILERLGSVPLRREVAPTPAQALEASYRQLVAEAGNAYDAQGPHAHVLATSQLVLLRWLPRLLHNGDVHCMAFGLEPRVPFASRRVLELALRVSPALALAGGVEKALLREALRGLLPEPLRLRRKSALPKDQDVGPLYQAQARQLWREPHPLVRRLVDLDALAPLLAAPALNERERAQLFRVLCLQHWAYAHEVVP